MSFLSEPGRTEYDLNFNFLGFACRVHPFFWILAAFLGMNYKRMDLVIIWIGVVFVSILVHELGHALAFRRYRINSRIVLYAFGGLAIPSGDLYGTRKNIFVLAAGPFAGFGLALAVFGLDLAMAYQTGFPTIARTLVSKDVPLSWLHFKFLLNSPALFLRLHMLLVSLYLVNTFWGILNLVPLFPLDGGQISARLLAHRWPSRGMEYALKLSILTAFSLGAWFLTQQQFYNTILFVILGIQNVAMLQSLGRRYHY